MSGLLCRTAWPQETSPYLLQHADNPVDWFPWGEEALALRARGRPAAARLDRLLGLPLVPRDGARVLRGPAGRRGDERALRVREGRPRGAPGRRRDLHGRAAGDDRPRRLAAERVPAPRRRAVLRRHLLPAASRARGCRAGSRCSRASRTRGASSARRSSRRRRRSCRGCRAPPRSSRPAARPTERSLDEAVTTLRRAYDAEHGGWGGAPKFPQASVIEFLLRRGEREMALHTLRRMASRRHVRPGRRRLRPLQRRRPLDRPPLREDALRQRAARPRVPARLAGHGRGRCSCAWSTETLDWALRELRQEEGGFASALDADSEGVEGKFYVWTPDEVRDALPEDLAPAALQHFGIAPGGNFEGASIPVRAHAGPGAARRRSRPACSPRASSACARASTTSG